MTPAELENYEQKGQLIGFPKEIIARMLDCQVEQGNKRDVTVFEKYKDSAKTEGGFDWDKTKEKDDFWVEVIIKENFYAFFENYHKQEVSQAFKAGVEFAQEWIPVNKELPKWYTGCRLDILVKRETFKYPASVKIHTILSDKDIQKLKEMYTHWRLIEVNL